MEENILRTAYWHGYLITGNQYVAIAVNVNDPEDSHYFTIDPEVNNDAFVRACGWAYEPPPCDAEWVVSEEKGYFFVHVKDARYLWKYKCERREDAEEMKTKLNKGEIF